MKDYRCNWQSRGGSWYGWQAIQGVSAEHVKAMVMASGLCGDASTIVVESRSRKAFEPSEQSDWSYSRAEAGYGE